MRLVTSKNRAMTKILGIPCQYTVSQRCNLMLAQQRGLPSAHTRSNAVILHDTLPAEFIEKAICMKTKDQLYRRESVVLRPRVVLKANSQSGSQDLPVQEARSILGITTRCGELRRNMKPHRRSTELCEESICNGEHCRTS